MLDRIKAALGYYWQAKTLYQIHSPRAFEFAQQLVDDDRDFYVFGQIETYRALLKSRTEILEIKDLGAGSTTGAGNKRAINEIAQSALSPRKWGKLLFKLAAHYKPKTILEFGTSLGVSTMYLAAADSNARVVTMEGSPEIAQVAREGFARYEYSNITSLIGSFDDRLEEAIAACDKRLDLVYIDGDHREEPTIRYFERIKPYLHDDSIVIFDDVYWSSGMTAAWERIKSDPQVRLSIDLYKYGVIFMTPDLLEEKHLKIVSSHWKPWAQGLFG